jgi:pimeloyl-ACP methyl ester carboxylesterase
MEALLDEVRQLMNAEHMRRAAVVGHSLGGALALHLALREPERVSDLVLAAPVGLRPIRFRRFARIMTPAFTERFASRIVPRAIVAFLLRGAYGDPTTVAEHDIDEYWAPSRYADYYIAVRALLRDFSWEPLATGMLRAIQPRALVILGTADRLISGAKAPAMRLQHPTLLVLKGAGHLAIEERYQRVNEAILRFLAGEVDVA